VLASAIYYSKKREVDGIIYLTPFSCSSDSLVTEYMLEHKKDKPFMTVTVDEHSGDAGLITRIEAFIDMIERKKLHKKKTMNGITANSKNKGVKK
jgi:predicted nucleotide-binding protein (sugar kinase/HSP70/actin superfamily)